MSPYKTSLGTKYITYFTYYLYIDIFIINLVTYGVTSGHDEAVSMKTKFDSSGNIFSSDVEAM